MAELLFAGIDGCRAGWLMVARADETASPEVHIAASFAELPPARYVAIDMPIGLPDTGYRACDMAARALLQERRSSVFPGLRRPLLNFDDYAAANAWAKSDGAGISKQAWNILPKVRELDGVMSPARQVRIREAHPELAFMVLARKPLALPKRDLSGLLLRRDLLLEAGFDGLDELMSGLDRKRAQPDDLLDACALCLTATRVAHQEAVCLPADPDADGRGLRMEIWY